MFTGWLYHREAGSIAASLPPHPYGLVRVQLGREPMAVPSGEFAFHSSSIPAPPYGVVRLHLGREPMAVPLGGFAIHSSPIPAPPLQPPGHRQGA